MLNFFCRHKGPAIVCCALFLMLLFAVSGFFFLANRKIAECEKFVYCLVENIPRRETGLLLGTSKRTGNSSNLYFDYRISAAARLYHAGKISKIIVSGDNGRKGYDETSDMRDALIRSGVKPGDILPDYAGFRTLDSVLRARSVYGQTSFTVISQKFHCERAIYIASENGMDAIGFAARDVPRNFRIKTFFREPAARMLAFLDVHVFKSRAKFEK